MKHCQVREELKWGTYGKHQNYPLTWVVIKLLSDEHIKAILRTQYHIEQWLRDTFCEELIFRAFNDIYIPEVEHYYET